MKKIILIIIALYVVSENTFSQQWDELNNIQGYNQLVRDVKFVNANTGYVVLQGINSSSPIRVLKTINKGNNWTVVYSIGSFSSGSAAIECLDANICFIYYDNKIYKTVNSFNSTSQVATFSTNSVSHRIKFANPSVGYALHSKGYGNPGVSIYKSTDGGNTWNTTFIFNEASYNVLYSELNDICIPSSDPNYVFVCGYVNISLANNATLLWKTSDGFETQVVSYPITNVPGIVSQLSSPPVNNATVFALPDVGFYAYDGNTFSVRSYLGSSWGTFQSGLSFSNNNIGFVGMSTNKIFSTSDGGYNWTQEYTSVNMGRSRMYSSGDVAYMGGNNGTIFTRKPQFTYKTYYDNSEIGTNNAFTVDGVNKNTTTTDYTKGGGLALNINQYVNNNPQDLFYKWNDNSTSYYIGNHNYIWNGEISAYYKGKFISTSTNAIGPVSQVKMLKDTVINSNNTVHLVSESMGGIFYTKTTNNGSSFQPEEVVNYSPTENDGDNNKNACLNIIRTSGGHEPLTIYDENRNVACVWERYNSSNNKIELRVATRALNVLNNYEWSRYADNFGSTIFASFDANSSFESKPKIFAAAPPNITDYAHYIFVVPHLRPNGSQSKLIVTVKYFNTSHDWEIDNGNISDMAVTGYNSYGMFHLHFTYKLNGAIKYKYGEVGYDPGVGNYYYAVPALDFIVSGNEIQNARYTPDITLRNAGTASNPDMLPVVTYQGQYATRIIVGVGTNGPQTIDGTYYPIIIREKIHTTNQGDIWASQNMQYNSLEQQQNPNIEGSKTKNSYIVNFSQNNSTFYQKLPRWEGSTTSGYYCSPGSFSGKDAKLVKGGLVNQNSTSQSIITLSNSSAPYQVGKQNFSITNGQGGAGTAGAFDGVNAVLVNDNVAYSFNLGSIMVNSNMINFNINLDTNIDSAPGLNENMKSNPFLLHENDTLILGRDAYYLPTDSVGTFKGIEYWVDLMDKNKNMLQRNLIHDTLHVNDTMHLDYLEGFIITDVPSGTDSFYVQLRIDTIRNDNTGLGGISGDGGATCCGDNSQIKKYVFWHDSKLDNTHNNIPIAFNLYQNYPNPFNPETKIKYDLPKNTNVTVKIYNLLGQLVSTLVNNEFRNAGRYEATWNANNFASGVYIYKIEADSYIETKKMILLK